MSRLSDIQRLLISFAVAAVLLATSVADELPTETNTYSQASTKIPPVAPDRPTSVLDFKMKQLDGEEVVLKEKYAGKVVLIVNVASKCGLTRSNYTQLQALFDAHEEEGLAIVGFPCNQFGGQEPGTADDIRQFCSEKYNVTFDLFSKIEVNGDKACDLYKTLKSSEAPPVGTGDIKWNFEKFLIDREGKLVGRFSPRTAPNDEDLLTQLKSELAKEAPTSSALDFTMKKLDGEEVDLKEAYDGKVVLIVNVASKCGLTRANYTQLQALHEAHKEQGLAILGFPCNQFGGQEPGTADDIKQFCSENYGVTFDMFSKVEVNGDAACDLYKSLKSTEVPPVGTGDIKWNFEKFLIGRDGQLVGRFSPRTAPNDEELLKTVKGELAKEAPPAAEIDTEAAKEKPKAAAAEK